jgi:rhamnosyltransferase
MSGAAPDVSIALLTKDAGALLERLLEAIERQETGRTVEVLAIDSGSRDNTVATLERHGVDVESIPPEEFNFGSTRDQIYQRARGSIVVNLSQDAIPAHARWLENLIEPLSDEGTAVSCGASIPDEERAYPQFPWERNGYLYFTREIKKFVRVHGKGVSFANSAVKRSVWEELRFDPIPLGEDFQFQTKLNARGLNAAFPKDASVLHHHNYELRSLYARCRNEGLALRMLGATYNEWDLLCDLAGPRKYIQWLRELRRGSLNNSAALLFPVLRPLAVYAGSRWSSCC